MMETVGYYLIVFSAGHDTTKNALVGGMNAFLEHPEELAKLQRDPGLIDQAVDELTRWTSPVNYMKRTATEDTVVGGQPIAAGDRLVLFYASANRDEDVFDDPFEFRIDRPIERHLAFGVGEHFCLGANLAKRSQRALWLELARAAGVDRADRRRRNGSTRRSSSASSTCRCATESVPRDLSTNRSTRGNSMTDHDGKIFDADNHYYEAPDAFTRHVPKKMRARCVEWVEMDNGRRYQIVGGRIDRTDQPDVQPDLEARGPAGVLQRQPRGVTSAELMRRLARADAARVHGPRRPLARARRAGPHRRMALPDARRALRGAAQARHGRRCARPSAPSTSGSTKTGASPTEPSLRGALHLAGRRRLGLRPARLGARSRRAHPGDAPERGLHPQRSAQSGSPATSTRSGRA